MSDSVRPHRWQPTRLPHPWDSPGKNTGVGCHFLLQCMTVKRESEAAQSCPILSDPVNCSLAGSSVHGIFQARELEWVAIAFSHLLPSPLFLPLLYEANSDSKSFLIRMREGGETRGRRVFAWLIPLGAGMGLLGSSGCFKLILHPVGSCYCLVA